MKSGSIEVLSRHCRVLRLYLTALLALVMLSGCLLEKDEGHDQPPPAQDTDGDEVYDHKDNCPAIANTDQQDFDGDGIGDACDPDKDSDGLPDKWETRWGLDPLDPDSAGKDPDRDGLSNLDEYLAGSNPRSPDVDHDGLNDSQDNCPQVANADQADFDADGLGNACDPDMDGDGFSNEEELAAGFDPLNADEDHPAGSLMRVTVNRFGEAAEGFSHSPTVSADASTVAFVSSSPDLVVGDFNARSDVFVAELGNRKVETMSRISQASNSAGGNQDSLRPLLSADGNVVAFDSRADNLVPGDENGQQDVFVYDRSSAQMALASVSASGEQASGFPSYVAALARDGGAVYFNSNALNLADGMEQYRFHLLRHDRTTGQLAVYPGSVNASLSGDEAWVAMESPQDDLVVTDRNKARDIFFFAREGMALPQDQQAIESKVRRVNVTATNPEANGDAFRPALSADGQYVVFESDATNLAGGDTNGKRDIFLHNVARGKTTRLTRAWNGGEANGDSFQATLSDDGRFVAFASDASNLVEGDFNQQRDIFLYDRELDFLRRINVSPQGIQADRESDQPQLSADGRCVVFVSSASTLDDLPDNQQRDVYLYCRPRLE